MGLGQEGTGRSFAGRRAGRAEEVRCRMGGIAGPRVTGRTRSEADS